MNSTGQLIVPGKGPMREVFKMVACSDMSNCFIFADGRMECFGEILGDPDVNPPADLKWKYVSPSVLTRSCGVLENDTVLCWCVYAYACV